MIVVTIICFDVPNIELSKIEEFILNLEFICDLMIETNKAILLNLISI